MKFISTIFLTSLLSSSAYSSDQSDGNLWHSCHLVTAEGEQAIVSFPLVVNFFLGKKLSESKDDIRWNGYLTMENRNKGVYIFEASVVFDKAMYGGYRIFGKNNQFKFTQFPLSEKILSYRLTFDANSSGTYDCVIADPEVEVGH